MTAHTDLRDPPTRELDALFLPAELNTLERMLERGPSIDDRQPVGQ
jgi:hypothetical protein